MSMLRVDTTVASTNVTTSNSMKDRDFMKKKKKPLPEIPKTKNIKAEDDILYSLSNNSYYYRDYQQPLLLTQTFYDNPYNTVSTISTDYPQYFQYNSNMEWKVSNTDIKPTPQHYASDKLPSNQVTYFEKPHEPNGDELKILSTKSSAATMYSESVATPQSTVSFQMNKEYPSLSFSAAEKFFQQPLSPYSTATAQRIPSPWDSQKVYHRISTGSIPNMAVYTAQVPEEISNVSIQQCQKESNKYGLSIASCSLINMKSNIKLYRRMAAKTNDKETQLTYAKYLIQISRLYDSTCSTTINHTTNETPAETRHRLLSEAAYWINRLAKSGQSEALFILGQWYLLGPDAKDCINHKKVQESKAFKCFLRSSKSGYTDAHYELAHLYKKRGQFEKAIHTYKKGANENHTLSIYKVAKIYLRGQLKTKKDILKGLDYLKRAADMTDVASGEPAFVLGCIYANEINRIGIQRYLGDSIDIVQDKNLALKYLKKSAEIGYPDAIYFMGQIVEQGMLGQLCDAWQAYQYYMKAADVNHAGAMLDLSRIYLEGIPGLLAPQKDIAFKWCKRSADIGFDQAEYVLGQYYENGIGVVIDLPRALEYYGKAASKGYQLAAEKLNRTFGNEKVDPGLSIIVSSMPKVSHDEDDDHRTKNHQSPSGRHQNSPICHIQ